MKPSRKTYFVDNTTMDPNSDEYVTHYGNSRSVDMTLEAAFQSGGGRLVQYLLDHDDGVAIGVASFASTFFFQRHGDKLGARALLAELPPHVDDVAPHWAAQKAMGESNSVYKESERLSNPTKRGIPAGVQPGAGTSSSATDPTGRQAKAGQPRQRNRARG